MKTEIREGRNSAKIFLILAVAFIISIMAIKTVYALGVAPGRIVVNFEPNLEKTITLNILNNEHRDFKAAVFVRGDLANYITLKESVIEFRADEESTTTSYTLKLPSSIDKPGLHTSDIVIREISTAQGAEMSIGYLVSVASQLYVQVPYPGKYAEISLDIISGKIGEDVNFYVPVLNLGQEDIDAKVIITIFEGDKQITRIESNEKLVKPRERQELKATWKAEAAGVLKAVATVDYRTGEAKAEKEFFVQEEFLVQPLDISVEKFKLGEIAKFNILVENIGTRKIFGVSSRISLLDKDKEIADSKSPAIDLEAGSRGVMNSYWDTKDVKEGVYEGRVALNYEDKSSEKAIRTTLTRDSIKTEIIGISARAVTTVERKNNLSLLWAIIIVLLVANLAWFIYFRRKQKK